MLLMLYSYQTSAILAADHGATIAIVLALITLLGTISAQLVTWHKIRTDAKTASTQFSIDSRRSDVELAQEVMSQTVVVLNDRLKSEGQIHEARITRISALHSKEIEDLKTDHKRDVSRLERKIDRLQADWDSCKARNEELTSELANLKQQRRDSGT